MTSFNLKKNRRRCHVDAYYDRDDKDCNSEYRNDEDNTEPLTIMGDIYTMIKITKIFNLENSIK